LSATTAQNKARPARTRPAPFVAPAPPRFASAPPREASGEHARQQDLDDNAFEAAAAAIRAKWETKNGPDGTGTESGATTAKDTARVGA